MAKPDPEQLRAAARSLPEQGLPLRQLLALAPGGELPAMVILCTLPAALPGLQLGWVAVPALLYLARALWKGQLRVDLPDRLANFMVSRKSATAILNAFAWIVERFGSRCRSTWPGLVRRTRRRPAAVLVAAMSLVILLPLPGSNVVPAIAIISLMGGLVWRDGRAIAAAGVLAVAGIALVAGLAWAAWAAAAALA
ncbi:MAG: exopolysaccharide biosynthesis protein [Burkholderiales bacterium]|nr:exopolysaccharide biosynthesis protein [Burkholderiales bacterium]